MSIKYRRDRLDGKPGKEFIDPRFEPRGGRYGGLGSRVVDLAGQAESFETERAPEVSQNHDPIMGLSKLITTCEVEVGIVA